MKNTPDMEQEAPILTRGGSAVFSEQSAKPSAPASAAAARAILCQVVREAVMKQCGEDLIALILTGSEARNEGTFYWSLQGFRLLGDVEFVLVTKQGSAPRSVASMQQEVESELARRGIYARIEFGVVRRNYLLKLPRNIYSYELRHCGRVIAGDPNILAIVPEFPASSIDQEDAWRLLCNRIIELLHSARGLEQRGSDASAKFQYALVKLYLDMTTSLLVFLGGYEPTYQARARKLEVLTHATQMPMGLPFPLGEFAHKVSLATEWKLNPQRQQELDGQKAILHAIQLWKWEAARLTSGQDEPSIRAIWCRLAQQQTGAKKLRGWLYVARRQGWIKSWRNWPRWIRLGWRASPRYWLYLVAVELLSRRSVLDGCEAGLQMLISDFKSLQTFLPDRPKEAEVSGPEWDRLVDDVAWNYKRFLMGTRACTT